MGGVRQGKMGLRLKFVSTKFHQQRTFNLGDILHQRLKIRKYTDPDKVYHFKALGLGQEGGARELDTGVREKKGRSLT